MEKIKINLTKKTLNDLTNDMITFEYYKKDGQINKNGFINTLLKNYFSIYDNQASELIEKYTKIVTNHIYEEKKANQLINDLVAASPFFTFNKQDILETSISFKLINSNHNIFKIIENKYLSYQSISSFFRNMIDSYLSLPKYKREQIIYLNTYELLMDAINDNRKIKVFLKSGDNREFIPCAVANSKEEIYNYLISISEDSDKRHVSSIHLSRIDSIYLLKEKYLLNSQDKEKIESVIENGAQFPYTNPCIAQIKLTTSGQRLFRKKYLNRPTPINIESDVYYFNCSFDQLLLYFFSFGKEALVLSPKYLKEKLKKQYIEAYKNYCDEEINSILLE